MIRTRKKMKRGWDGNRLRVAYQGGLSEEEIFEQRLNKGTWQGRNQPCGRRGQTFVVEERASAKALGCE